MAQINWTNVTDLGQLPGQANVASDGTFWVGMFYMMWLILMLIFIYWGFEVAVVVASFIMLVLGLLAVYAGLFAWTHLLSIVGVLLFMFLYIIWSSAKVRT